MLKKKKKSETDKRGDINEKFNTEDLGYTSFQKWLVFFFFVYFTNFIFSLGFLFFFFFRLLLCKRCIHIYMSCEMAQQWIDVVVFQLNAKSRDLLGGIKITAFFFFLSLAINRRPINVSYVDSDNRVREKKKNRAWRLWIKH